MTFDLIVRIFGILLAGLAGLNGYFIAQQPTRWLNWVALGVSSAGALYAFMFRCV